MSATVARHSAVASEALPASVPVRSVAPRRPETALATGRGFVLLPPERRAAYQASAGRNANRPFQTSVPWLSRRESDTSAAFPLAPAVHRHKPYASARR